MIVGLALDGDHSGAGYHQGRDDGKWQGAPSHGNLLHEEGEEEQQSDAGGVEVIVVERTDVAHADGEHAEDAQGGEEAVSAHGCPDAYGSHHQHDEKRQDVVHVKGYQPFVEVVCEGVVASRYGLHRIDEVFLYEGIQVACHNEVDEEGQDDDEGADDGG